MIDSPFLAEIHSIPGLIDNSNGLFLNIATEIAASLSSRRIDQIIMTGCGDSYFAAVAARLAFQQLTGMPSYAMTAMELSRYQVSQLKKSGSGRPLVIAISTSGQVSRTIEALSLAKRTGAETLAITGNKESELGSLADTVFSIRDTGTSEDHPGVIIPGTRSYCLSFLALAHLAAAMGAQKNNPVIYSAENPVNELDLMATLARKSLESTEGTVIQLIEEWQDASHFVFCGSGPNYGTAMYSAAKIIEAAGDPAIGQDLEEWAHLQYFESQVRTPTIIISNLIADVDRTLEVLEAARAIGRRVAVVAPENRELGDPGHAFTHLKLAGPIKDRWSPLLTALPGMLLAAYRSQQRSEPFFRDFGGGRSRVGGGGISRIRDSHRMDQQE